MKLRTLILVVVLAAVAAFAALNWTALATPSDLSLGVATVRLPLGLVMLALLVLLTVLFLSYLVYLQTSTLLEARRHSREVQVHRERADLAEASRFTELRGFLEAELAKQTGLHAESRAALLARVEQLDRDLRVAVEQAGNTLAAYIGELEDRLHRNGRPGD